MMPCLSGKCWKAEYREPKLYFVESRWRVGAMAKETQSLKQSCSKVANDIKAEA